MGPGAWRTVNGISERETCGKRDVSSRGIVARGQSGEAAMGEWGKWGVDAVGG